MGNEITYSNGELSLAFSPLTGMLEHLGFVGGESVVHPSSSGCGLDACFAWKDWLSANRTPQLVTFQPEDLGCSVKVSYGPLTFRDRFKLDGSLIQRSLEVENNSDRELQLTSVRLHLLGVTIGDMDACTVEAPATIVRPRVPLKIVAEQGIGGPWGPEFVPGSVGWLNTIRDAPDVTPGLAAVHNPISAESLLIWYHGEIEAATPQIYGDALTLNLGHEIGLAGWLSPGKSLQAGTQYIQLHRGSWSEALDRFQQNYRHEGVVPPLYGTPPDWVQRSAIYEAHPGPYGGFRGLTAELPRLREMGTTILYLMPVMSFDNRSAGLWDENWLGSGSPYAMRDFEMFEPSLGTEEDFRYLVDEAHRMGMKVLMDFVSQGCALDARYVTEHPEWFCRDELGNLVSSHGWVDTYSFDWANPDFQAYMLEWALRMVREFSIDGYRVDAPHGKEPNWDRGLPYHASYTSLGVLRLLEQLQVGIKQINPDAVLLCELSGPVFVKMHEFQYDYHLLANLHAMFSGRLTPFEFGEWLRDYWAVMPPSAVRVGFAETHDTRVGFPFYAQRGSVTERAMYAIVIIAGFVPMIWSGQEVGVEGFYRSVLTTRSQSQALLYGDRVFNTIPCGNPDVLSILCRHPDEIVWGVVSLHAERTPLEFDVAGAFNVEPSKHYRLHDLLSGQDWIEHGKSAWKGNELESIPLSLIPFRPYYFKIQPHPD